MRIYLEDTLGYVAYQAWSIVVGAFWFYFQIARAASPVADPATSMTAKMSNHGQRLFVHPWQQTLFWGALCGGMSVFAVAVVTMESRFGRQALQKLRPMTLTLAVIIAIVGWSFVIQRV
jgi:hypothetical protein